MNATAAIAALAATGWLIAAAAMAGAWTWQRRMRRRGLADATWPLVTAFFDGTSAILTLISTMFTLAWFQRNNEMTALMAAGVFR